MTLHHFTIDVEEYFHASALERAAPRTAWDGLPHRVEESLRRLTDLMGECDVRGTLFVLGWVAARHRSLIRELASAGHEIASHGWDHRRVTHQRPDEFRECVRRSKSVLEDLTGEAVEGFRAPSYSIVPGREWALDILIEEGYRYDSSLFPVRRRGYGYAGGGRDPHWLERPSGRLAEVPPATLRVGGVNLPAGGGAYFRLLPYGLTRAAFAQAERRGAPATFYTHPWEIDEAQPRLAVSAGTRLRHYGGIARMPAQLRRLLSTYRFQPIADTLRIRAAVRAGR
ncbi:MAG TPA: XrtA system polysaccharide deacetylase [Longimicrobiales bacterium]